VLTPEIIAEVGRAHAAGRRLYMAPRTSTPTGSSSGTWARSPAAHAPAAVELYRDVILASSSIPGAFPPVRIPIEIDGKGVRELHVDGGVSDEVIFRAFMGRRPEPDARGGAGAWSRRARRSTS